MRLSTLLSTLTALALALAMASPPAEAQRMYRWVDDQGNVHYSDRVPPDQVRQGREELNAQGVRIDQVDRAKTEEELAAEAELRRLAEEARLAEAERIRQEQVLLNSFSEESDLHRFYDERIDLLEQQTQATRIGVASQQRSLEELLARAAQLERSGRPVSEALNSSMNQVRRNIADQQALIERKEQERVEAQATYADHLERYRAAVAARQARQTTSRE